MQKDFQHPTHGNCCKRDWPPCPPRHPGCDHKDDRRDKWDDRKDDRRDKQDDRKDDRRDRRDDRKDDRHGNNWR